MTSIINQQLFAEAYLREQRAAKSSVDIPDASRQTIREWREEYPALDRADELLAYLPQCLTTLGFSYEQRSDPDYFLLYSDETHVQLIGACLAITDDQLHYTSKGRHHHARLVRLLRDQQLAWGIVTNGRSWRLCHAMSSAPYEVYLEADLDALLDPSQLTEFLIFYRFFHREAFEFVTGENGHVPRQGLDRMLAESEKRTQAIERHLKNRVDDLLQSLCLGFVEDEGAASYSREQLDEIYRNAIYLLYRTLFLFYAEARHLLPTQAPAYQPVGLASIVEDARLRQAEGVQNSDPHSLWKRLTHLFVVVDDGDASVGVEAYNGGLFSDTEKPYLHTHKMQDDYLAPALFDLGYIETKSGSLSIDYRDLSVRHLGTLYEGMLEYRLNLVTNEPVVVRDSGGKRIYLKQSAAGPIKRGETILDIGKVYFADDKGERKSSGSYYTPEDVVQYIVNNAVLPKLQELRAPLDAMLAEVLSARDIAASPAERDRIERYADQQILDLVNRQILGLRILDPAMGSGHFLVTAGQVVANFIVETLEATPWPNDTIDGAPLLWKRRVVERCLYGVDLNPLALELAKLALWINSASVGKPLTFLDHHLRAGNSLYGTPLKRLAALPNVKQPKDDPLFTLLRETVITDVLNELADITSVDSDTILAVKQKGEAFKQAIGKATRLRDIANVWLASLFGLPGSDDKPLGDKEYARQLLLLTQDHSAGAWESIVATDTAISAAREIAQNERFFHWELEFADVVVDGECRFDVVVANPPYVKTPPKRVITALYKTAKCADLYAWIFERALQSLHDTGKFGTIIPLSVMFAGDKRSLRDLLLSEKAEVKLISCDNIPDGIFTIPGSPMNSQRTTTLILNRFCTERKIRTTDHLRWFRSERPLLFDNLHFAETTRVASREYFPTIGKQPLVDFLEAMKLSGRTLKDITVEVGDYFLCVPSVARYFISAVPVDLGRRNQEILYFDCLENRQLAFCILNSNVFYWYWRSRSDGFWISREQMLSMPIPETNAFNSTFSQLASALWSVAKIENSKKMGTKMVTNYFFNKNMDILLSMDRQVVKSFVLDLDLPEDIFAQYKSSSFLRPLDLLSLPTVDELDVEE